MIFTLLFLTGIFAGTVDAVAGGGGLITLPILLSMGVPPYTAFGTNKLQGTIGTFFAARKYYQHGLISFNAIYKGIIFGLAGSIAGAVTVQVLSSDILRVVIPILLMLILFYTLVTPKFGMKEMEPKLNEGWFFILFGFGLGFYDGFFGPGTGSFWVFCLAFFLGYHLIKATAYTKIFNLNSSFVAMVCFGLAGHIDYRIGLTMAAGQIIGAKIGAHLAIRNGARLIRPVFMLVVFFTTGMMVYKTYSEPVILSRLAEVLGIAPSLLITALLFIMSALVIFWKRVQSSHEPVN